ncbi:hypothetical protein DFH94DRAFT_687893 [Russula ochroleuca]|uniref:Uncharacterized protein n=1 Tax=Russula ochroleuca TaxID=152965 RepID=A0A9P5N6R0_9AGAM|nr:hypothetical protein DFH94DRAFT_687893 [Russula ochroleuca]
MVNYNDPVTIAKDAEAIVKLWHLTDGIFIWEFFTTLHYEWDVIRGHRPYRWTIWVYSLARVTCLLSIILNIVSFDITAKIDCQVWATFLSFISNIASISSTLLIVLRAIAIWNKTKIVFAIAMVIWITDSSLYFLATIQLRAKWSPEANACTMFNIDSIKYAVIGSLVFDIGLLLIMLIGLLRLRHEGGAFAMGRTLWTQGLIWLLLATVGETPSVVLMILNLNLPLNIIALSPGMIIVTIAATRLYRSLINIYSSEISPEPSPGTGRLVSELRIRSGPIQLSQMEVTMRTECDPLPMSQMSRPSSYISADPQGRYKAHEVSLKVDVESGREDK